MNVTPIGGKSPTSTVIGIATDADGKLVTKKTWANESVVAYEMSDLPTSTDTIVGNNVDVSDCGAFSLRINNTTDAEYDIGFFTDLSDSSYTILRHGDATNIEFEIPSAKQCLVITPDDVPAMSWLMKVRLRILPKTVPTEGTLKIWVVKKM